MGAFWTYSLGVYGREEVRSSVLHLQEARGADVNLLLYAMWRASLGPPPFDRAHAAFLAARARAWREAAVEPLRAVRVGLRGGVAHVPGDEAEALRERVLALEIEAERVEQVVLETAGPPPEGRRAGAADPAAVGANLAAVTALGGGPLDVADLAALRALVAAVCPDADAGAVDRAMAVMS